MKQTTVFQFYFQPFFGVSPMSFPLITPGDFGRSTLVELHHEKIVIIGAYYNQQLFRLFP